MNNNIYYLMLVLIALLFILIIVLLFVIFKNSNNNSKDDFRININKDLIDFSNNLNNNFNNLNNSTMSQLKTLEEKVNSSIFESQKASDILFSEIKERIVKIDESQKSLNNLSKEIFDLQAILTDKKSRGTFGEIELYTLLENAFGLDNSRYEKQYTLSNNSKVDAIIYGPDGIGKICVDSKFPLENYRRMYDNNLSNIEKEKAINSFKSDVLKHIADIKNKYIIPGETADIAFMFLPAEAIFAELYGRFQSVIDKSYESKVYIVSPTTLMAYITAIKSIYLGQKKDEKAKEIEKLLNELSVEFNRLKDRSECLQRDFEKIIPDFEKVALTSNKIIKKFASINNGDIEN